MPNTPDGLPSNSYLWKLPSRGTQPRVAALRVGVPAWEMVAAGVDELGHLALVFGGATARAGGLTSIDRLAFVQQASKMTSVVDPVVRERKEDGGHRQTTVSSRWRG